MVLHLEFKFVITHFAYVGGFGIYDVSWNIDFVFHLMKFNEDELRDIKRVLRFDWNFSVYLPFIFSNLGFGILCLQVGTEYFKFPVTKIYFGVAQVMYNEGYSTLA